jgi:hypothetical protein
LPSHYATERNRFLTHSQPTKRPAAIIALAKIVDRPRLPKRSEITTLLSRIRTNRELRRSKQPVQGEARTCPICGIELMDDGNDHVLSCLDSRIQEERDEDQLQIYSIGGQTRVRTIGLLEGSVESVPGERVIEDGVDVFVDVEGDVDAIYGRTQYTDADLVDADSRSKGKPTGCGFVLGSNGRVEMYYLSECVLYTCYFSTMFSLLL